VLELIVSEHLYRAHPIASEGHLSIARSKIVNNSTLAESITFLNLNRFLRHNNPYLNLPNGIHTIKTKGDLFESLLCALMLDHPQKCSPGNVDALKKCSDFVIENLISRNPIDMDNLTLDPKSLYQHLMLCECHSVPEYQVVSRVDIELNREYTVNVLVNNKVMGTGFADSVRVAQRQAAENAVLLYLSHDHYQLDYDDIAVWPFNCTQQNKLRMLRKEIAQVAKSTANSQEEMECENDMESDLLPDI